MRIGLFAIAAIFSLGLTDMSMAQGQTQQVPTSWRLPTNDEILKILTNRIDVSKQAVGIIVGVIDPDGQRIISYGALNQNDMRPLNGDTVFEIGSITKVFTSLLLADMVQRGEVSLDDPVAKYLPPKVKAPVRDGKQITLIDLATHSSGLPRMPSNFHPHDLENPYADYTVDQLYSFLDSYTLPRDPGTQFEYSNLGGGLLGHVLSLRSGKDYESLVRERITVPLGMNDTAITLSADLIRRLAVGHGPMLRPVKNWDLPTLAGAGALRSTTNDLLKFLRAEIEGNSPLKAAMTQQLSVRRPTDAPDLAIALGWLIWTTPQGEVIWHNGGTGGYRSYIAFNPMKRTAVVVLINTFTAAGGDDIGFHILTGAPLANIKPAQSHTQVALDAKVKQGFVGQYQLAPNFILSITLEGDQLYAQATGQPRAPVFPESAVQLFYMVVDAQLTFDIGSDGRATGLTLHQNGRDIPAKRID